MLAGILVGAVFVAFGCYGMRRQRHLARVGQVTAAQVVDLKEERTSGPDGDDGSVFYPVVAFHVADGRAVRTPTRSGGYPPPARVGERVEVIYDPANPQNVALYPFRKSESALPIIALIVGIAITGYVIFQHAR